MTETNALYPSVPNFRFLTHITQSGRRHHNSPGFEPAMMGRSLVVLLTSDAFLYTVVVTYTSPPRPINLVTFLPRLYVFGTLHQLSILCSTSELAEHHQG